ncbi:hypothetical protein SU65_11840 [Flavobacterium psychrophilum]|nr:hypothetical protein SU65_11840 [Flavobacterium psychrophilum]
MLSAQEKLTKEEKARREKNIQAGNPFAKYGYKAKVATLSKGKYLEFHDLDSIVTIGTSRWHVDNKKIVGDIVIDSLNVDAQPIGDAPGMWMSPDPLSEEFPSYSPYTYAMNNPVNMVDPDGRFPYPIHIRSFAPFPTFGGGFAGDGAKRGYTTTATATARLSQSFTMDPTKHSYSGLSTTSSPSSHPILGTATANDDRGKISGFTYSENKNGSNTVNFTSTMAGANPLTKRIGIPTPDIDVKTKFTMTEDLKAGTLSVNAVQTGDAFPAAETFMNDTAGNPLFIGVSPAIGNPLKSLPGDGGQKMMSANFTISIDNKGVFTGVKQGDRTYTTAEWNKINQNKPTVKE